MKIVSNLSVQNMVSLAIRQLAAFKWPPAAKFPYNFPANFESLITVYRKISTLFRLNYAVSIISFILYSAVTFLAVTLPACVFLYLSTKTKFDEPFMSAANFAAEINEESSEEVMDLRPVDENVYSRRFPDEIVTSSDDELTYYDAEEIQFQETLLASIFPSQLATTPPIVENTSRSFFCEICLEDKPSWQMFENDKCSHSFCYDCTSSHIVSKIQDKAKEIPCPALNCNAVLNSDICRLMIPEKALVQLDEILCMSLIPDSQKLYCPFRDCSALLVKDYDDGIVGKITCVVCKRRFCVECRVDWHSNFTCKEYQKHFARKGGKSDKIVKMLAKKKKWQKCPKCKMYVEKAEGCVHITCRCKYEFCYRCGSKWTDSHGNCQQKS